MHDFCICADNAAKGKGLAALLKYLSKRGFPRSDVHKGSIEQIPLAWAASAVRVRETVPNALRNRMLQPSDPWSVCNTLFAGAAVRLL